MGKRSLMVMAASTSLGDAYTRSRCCTVRASNTFEPLRVIQLGAYGGAKAWKCKGQKDKKQTAVRELNAATHNHTGECGLVATLTGAWGLVPEAG